MTSYKEATGIELDEKRLLLNQIVKEIGIKHAEKKVSFHQSEIVSSAQQEREKDKKLELEIRKNLFRQRFSKLAS